MLIDCHAHLADAVFEPDRRRVLERAAAAGVGCILVVGEDPADNRRVEALCAAGGPAPRLLACFGFHPDRFADDRPLPAQEDIQEFFDQVRTAAGRLAAIGEVGLDRRVAVAPERRRAQQELLERIAAVAGGLGLALNVHARSAGHYALDLLRAAGARRVLMHAFDGKASHAVRGAADGFVFSIPPSVVRSAQKQKLVRALPLESLVLESDAPVLGPVRGERGEPARIEAARDAIAGIHGVSPERVEEVTTHNASKLFDAI